MEKIYKNIGSDTIENILSKIEFLPEGHDCYSYVEDEIAEMMEMDDFMEGIRDWQIVDFLGCGYLVIDGKIAKDSSTYIFCNCFKVCEEYFISFGKLKEYFGERVKVLWVANEDF